MVDIASLETMFSSWEAVKETLHAAKGRLASSFLVLLHRSVEVNGESGQCCIRALVSHKSVVPAQDPRSYYCPYEEICNCD
ncbi:hypothetical protein BYT27DRAFT_6894552 [Phlegmacium glaucopus]|nr:hypothetical protein BYT27DRAFT_6894552 [Phlegmacium glaucopus]